MNESKIIIEWLPVKNINIIDRAVSELLEESKVYIKTRTHGVITTIGGELYPRFGASEQELLEGYAYFSNSSDAFIACKALKSILEIKVKIIKRKYT